MSGENYCYRAERHAYKAVYLSRKGIIHAQPTFFNCNDAHCFPEMVICAYARALYLYVQVRSEGRRKQEHTGCRKTYASNSLSDKKCLRTSLEDEKDIWRFVATVKEGSIISSCYAHSSREQILFTGQEVYYNSL